MVKNPCYITTGEFAKFAQSTKRTVVWYDTKKILKPSYINKKGYRYYLPEQIIDFQVITLLRRLGFSLQEIKKLLNKNSNIKDIFKQKQLLIKSEIDQLKQSLQNISNYYQSLDSDGVLARPHLKQLQAFKIFYLDKSGPYSEIYEYGFELKSYLQNVPQNAKFATFFYVHGYFPTNDNFKIAIIAEQGIKVKPEYKNLVRTEVIPSLKTLSYTHIGPPSLISMIIKQLRLYFDKNQYTFRTNLSFSTFEIYHKTGFNNFHQEDQMVSEIIFPIQ